MRTALLSTIAAHAFFLAAACTATDGDGTGTDTDTGADGAGGGDFGPNAPVELLCEEADMIVSGPTCGNGVADPGEICFTRTQLSTLDTAGSVSHGDIDEDGAIDLVTGSRSAVHIHWGSETEPFAETATYETGVLYSRVAVADANGDGHLDVIGFGAHTGGGTGFVTLIGDGTRELSFSEFQATDTSVYDFIAVRDMNGDGFDDLVGSFYTILITAFGAAEDPLRGEVMEEDYPVRIREYHSAVGDVKVGGAPELVVLNDAENEVLFHSWDGDPLPPYTYDPEDGFASLALADVDGDGALDISMGIVSCMTKYGDVSSLAVALGDGEGGFGELASAPLACFLERPFLVGGRFTKGASADSLAVVEASEGFEGTSQFVVGFASWTDEGMQVRTCYDHSKDGLVALDVADLNDDGVDDLLVSTQHGVLAYESGL